MPDPQPRDPQPAATPRAAPVAVLRARHRWSLAWLLPLLALGLAGVAAARAWKGGGPHITVHFSDGHGLRVNDTLRHRGIVVGQVKALHLDDDLTGVTVELRLEQSAERLARDGSLFWIVRPQFGWSGIAGLDTLAGARYLDVLPGSGGARSEFEGVDDIPITAMCPPGSLEILVQAPSRGGVRPGSMVTYRQLPVGRVVSTGLASDAGCIELRVDIDPPYAALVRERSCFWETSGVNLHVGLKDGLSVGFDSPEALLGGGLTLATPPQAGEPVSTGHRFALQKEPKDEWLAWQPGLPIGNPVGPTADAPRLPRPLATSISWKRKELLRRERTHRGWTLAVQGGLLGPASLLRADKEAKDGTLVIEADGVRLPVTTGPTWEDHGIAVRAIGLPDEAVAAEWPRELMRRPGSPEDCLAIGDPALPPIAIDAARLTVDGAWWRVDSGIAIDASWHGAAVVARLDGQLIGVLMIDGDKPIIAPLGDPVAMLPAGAVAPSGASAP